jgi:hypothetical protein
MTLPVEKVLRKLRKKRNTGNIERGGQEQSWSSEDRENGRNNKIGRKKPIRFILLCNRIT